MAGQIDPDGVVTAGEHPHHGQAGQPGQQAAQEEPADPVGPLQVIDRDEQRLHGGEVFQAGYDAVGEQQRLADHGGDLLVLSAVVSGSGPARSAAITGAPGQTCSIGSHLLQPTRMFIRVACSQILREQRGLADTGRPGDQHAGTGSVLTGTTQRRQRTGHRLATTPQRS